MLPQVYALYYGREFKLDHVIIKIEGDKPSCYAYLMDEDGNMEVAPIKRITFLNSNDRQ
jgi:hypothetical protein